MTRTIPIDIEGLNLLLGGGIPVLKRHNDFDESATLLVRGPPGSGKTIFGVQLAGSLARSLGCDVAYGCVELLPTELEAQHAGIRRADFKERVVTAPFTKQKPKGDECRIFAEMLDIGSHGEEVSKLGDAIEHVLKGIERVGGRPRVLVIDSLSDGYNLGATAPRELADALCKMAARRGMILILLEEIFESRPSAWSFATDVVFQLNPSEDEHASGTSDSFGRRLTVSKNRLGPSEPGVHRFAIMAHFGISVLPAPRAYLSQWALNIVVPDWTKNQRQKQRWSIKLPDTWPRFQDCVTAIYGSDPVDIYRMVDKLGRYGSEGGLMEGSDVFLDFSREDEPYEPNNTTPGELWKISCGDPYLSGDELLFVVLASIDKLRAEKNLIRRLLIGDLQSLRSFWNPEGIRLALGVLIANLRRMQIPAILFETAVARTIDNWQTGGRNETFPVQQPRIVDFADVVIEIQRTPPGHPPSWIFSHARSGQREKLSG